jgi:molybdate transport system regulatory protein
MIPQRAGNSLQRWREIEMSRLRLKSRQWIVDDQDRIIMGEGRKEILETIERTGSINQTAKIMKMSYKGVWSKIKVTEEYLNLSIVHADRKMGSRLTKEGKELLEKYRVLKDACLEEDNRCFSRIFGGNWPVDGGKRE